MKYNLIVDEEKSIVRRSFVTIEAESLSEAVNVLSTEGVGFADEIISSEFIPDTEEYIDSANIIVMDSEYNDLT